MATTELSRALIYTPKQVADLLGVCEHTVRKWVRDGSMKGSRLGQGGRLIRIRASEVERFLEPKTEAGK